MVAHWITHQPDPNWPSYRSSPAHRDHSGRSAAGLRRAETGRERPGFGEGGWGANRVARTLPISRENDFGLLAAIGLILREFSTASRQLAVDALDGLGKNLSADLGQAVIVENQTGAGGRIGTKGVARAAPDGYALLLGGSNNNAITPAIYNNLDFDPVKDFAPVAAAAPPWASRRTFSWSSFARALERTSCSFLTRVRHRRSRTSWAAKSRST
jgi:hypothetical protein